MQCLVTKECFTFYASKNLTTFTLTLFLLVKMSLKKYMFTMPCSLFTFCSQFTTYISGIRIPGVCLFKTMPVALVLLYFFTDKLWKICMWDKDLSYVAQGVLSYVIQSVFSYIMQEVQCLYRGGSYTSLHQTVWLMQFLKSDDLSYMVANVFQCATSCYGFELVWHLN